MNPINRKKRNGNIYENQRTHQNEEFKIKLFEIIHYMWLYVCVWHCFCVRYIPAHYEDHSSESNYKFISEILKTYSRYMYSQQVILKPGTQMRDMYDALPFPLIFKVYLFNVLNPDDVMVGKKPILQEIGPFVFK